jgi:predicted dehydrogenase
MKDISRRQFLGNSVKAGAAAAVMSSSLRAVGANERIRIGVMGLGGRGSYLATVFAERADVEIAYLCDADSRVLPERAAKLEAVQGKRPQTFTDVRRMLEAPDLDAMINATPDHWHALGTIMACQAGKDVYVEKPASHSIWEGRKMVEAARKYNRVVQLGTQTRSGEYAQEAVGLLRSGKIGKVHLVKVFNMLDKGLIKTQADQPVPDGVNYDMWLGPAAERAFNLNHFRGGCWNWFWEYSGGDIINDGVHQMDFARWAIGQAYPTAVTSTGGLFELRDGRDCPDTQIVTYDFDDLTMVFELAMWTPYITKTALEVRDIDGLPDWPHNGTRIELYGTDGMMLLGRHGDGWEIYGLRGEKDTKRPGKEPTRAHIENFVQCIRSRRKPNADIEEGHLSTNLCHLGNISYRVGGRRLLYDGKTETFVADEEANNLAKRTYRKPWVVPEEV